MDLGGLAGLQTGVENYIFWSESGQDLEKLAEHPHQEFPGEPPGALITRLVCILETSLSVSLPISICIYFYTHAVINYLVAMTFV